MTSACAHDGYVSATHERGPYCCECNEPIVGFFTPISRNTLAGALLWAMKNSAEPMTRNGEGND